MTDEPDRLERLFHRGLDHVLDGIAPTRPHRDAPEPDVP